MFENTDRYMFNKHIFNEFSIVRVNFTFMWSPEINFLDFIKVKEQT